MTPAAAEPFLWGVATSAFQIEGSPHADWTAWDPLAGAQPGMTGHYERFREDVALLRDLGVNAYRFSVEWSRIQPGERVWDDTALEHYRQLVDGVARERDRAGAHAAPLHPPPLVPRVDALARGARPRSGSPPSSGGSWTPFPR